MLDNKKPADGVDGLGKTVNDNHIVPPGDYMHNKYIARGEQLEGLRWAARDARDLCRGCTGNILNKVTKIIHMLDSVADEAHEELVAMERRLKR
jgi:hypothetical protein